MQQPLNQHYTGSGWFGGKFLNSCYFIPPETISKGVQFKISRGRSCPQTPMAVALHALVYFTGTSIVQALSAGPTTSQGPVWVSHGTS